MNEEKFRHLVADMRGRQRAWYKDHKHADLVTAKQLEKQVDDEIKKCPDFPSVMVIVHTTEEFQRQMSLVDPSAQYVTTSAGEEEERKLRLHLEDERDAGEPERADDLDLSEE